MLSIVRKILTVLVALAAATGMMVANAALPGAYLGAEMGWGDVHEGAFANAPVMQNAPGPIVSFSNSGKDTGFAGRVFGGYQFTPNWAAELGLSRFTVAEARATATTATGNAIGSGTIKTSALDLVGKGILILRQCISLYGKLGLAYIATNGNVNVTQTVGSTVTGSSFSQIARKVYPTFGVGMSYDITQNLVTDVSWNRIQKTGNGSIPNTDLVGVGLSYYFG